MPLCGRTVLQLALDRRDIDWRRHILNDGVQHGLNTLVLERGTAKCRYDLVGQRTDSDTPLDIFVAQTAFFEVLVHQLFAGLGRGFNHLLAHTVALINQFGRDLALIEGRTHVIFVPVNRLHPDQVDHTFKVLFCADCNLHGYRIRAQPIPDLIHHAHKISAGAIHLVNESHARHVVLVRLAPYGFRLGLDPTDSTEHRDGTVEYTQGTLDFDGEINVPRRIDDIDTVFRVLLLHAFPETGRRSRGNGNPALLLLLHPVHGSGTIVHFADLVRDPGIEKNALGRGRLARVDMRHDADIAIALYRSFAGHCCIPEAAANQLPAEVCECLVSLGHTVSVFTFFDCTAAVF